MKSTSKLILSDLLHVDFLSSNCNDNVVSKPRISLFSPSKLSDDNSVHRKSKVFLLLFLARWLVIWSSVVVRVRSPYHNQSDICKVV